MPENPEDLTLEQRRAQTIQLLGQYRADGIGIVWDEKNPMALINGQILKPGSTFLGAEVKEITPNSVIFLVEGQEYILSQ